MNIAKQLQTDDLSASKCEELLTEVNGRMSEVSRRIEAIKPSHKGRPAGAARRQLLTTGTSDEIKALDNEHADLLIESEQLQAQRKTLLRRRDAARAREAAQSMPERYQKLQRRLEALQTAQQELADAWHEVDAVYADTWQARMLAINGGHSPAEAPAEMLDAIQSAASGPCGVTSRLQNMAQKFPHTMAEELGLEPSHDHLTAPQKASQVA